MKLTANRIKKWEKTMLKLYNRIEENPEYKIIPLNKGNITVFLIKLTPISGFHKGRTYILKMNTRYNKLGRECIFPFTPPQLKFMSKVYHSNVYGNGNICLDVLKDNWTPIMGFNIIKFIILFLNDSNPNSAANGQAGRQEKQFTREYNACLKQMGPLTENERDSLKNDIFKDYIDKIRENDSFNEAIYEKYRSYFE